MGNLDQAVFACQPMLNDQWLERNVKDSPDKTILTHEKLCCVIYGAISLRKRWDELFFSINDTHYQHWRTYSDLGYEKHVHSRKIVDIS